MELQTAITLLALAGATWFIFRLIARPSRRARHIEQMRARLDWEQGR